MDAVPQVLTDLLGAETMQSTGRMAVALLLGLCLGVNREMRRKAAGLRSHMLVSLAAAAFTIMTFSIMESASKFGDNVRSDPIRLLEAVVTGVAFLGAGAVIQARQSVVGITTGASLWLAGALGVACGLGQFKLAVVATILGLVVLWALGWVEGRILRDGDPATGKD